MNYKILSTLFVCATVFSASEALTSAFRGHEAPAYVAQLEDGTNYYAGTTYSDVVNTVLQTEGEREGSRLFGNLDLQNKLYSFVDFFGPRGSGANVCINSYERNEFLPLLKTAIDCFSQYNVFALNPNARETAEGIFQTTAYFAYSILALHSEEAKENQYDHTKAYWRVRD